MRTAGSSPAVRRLPNTAALAELRDMQHNGFVSLVGAGPGDPDLLTVKALRLLKSADVVVYDRLVSAAILDLVPAGVGRISVGKSPGAHAMPQDRISAMITNLARAGRHVVRLKGGDPYVFGRGGEEALALARHGVAFEVVPGITAASGCSAYAGIPLTHRGLSRSVRFITGHFSNDEPLDIDWHRLADPDCTLLIYMGLANLQQICDGLARAGLAASTPAAAIGNGTTARQRRVLSRLDRLPHAVKAKGLEAPVMIIIGNVVSLADELDWFQHLQEETEHGTSAAAHQ